MDKVVNKKFQNYDYCGWGEPIVSLEDEYGGQSVVSIDDGCLVLHNGSDGRKFQSVVHWHEEVVYALRDYLKKYPDYRKKEIEDLNKRMGSIDTEKAKMKKTIK